MGWGLERSAGSREESDGCDLAGLFVLEHVDKNDQHKLRALHPPHPPSEGEVLTTGPPEKSLAL